MGLLVVLVATLVATSIGDESGLAMMDGDALPEKIDMKAIEKQVLDGVITAVAARTAKTVVAAKEEVEKETLQAEKKAELHKANATAEASTPDEGMKAMLKEMKVEKSKEKKKLESVEDKEAAKEAIGEMIGKAEENSDAAAELIQAAKTGVTATDVKEEHQATMAAFNPKEEEDDLDVDVHNQVSSYSVAENAKTHMEKEVTEAASVVASSVKSKYEKDALKTAMKKELGPAIAAAAKRVGTDLASGKYNAADFQSPLETPLEKKEIAESVATAKKDKLKVKKMKLEAAEETDPYKKQQLKREIRKTKMEAETAKETAKEIIEQPGGEKRTNTEEEDELKIQVTKAKLGVLNKKVAQEADDANEKIQKGVQAKKWADKEMRKSMNYAKKEKRNIMDEEREMQRQTAFKARETRRKAARDKEAKEREAEEMSDEAEKMAQDTGLPAIPKGSAGYGIMSLKGRNVEIEKDQKKKAAAAAASAAKERAYKANVIEDDSVHVIMRPDEPPGGSR